MKLELDGDPLLLGIDILKGNSKGNEEETLRFIEEVQQNEAIWNRKMRQYRDCVFKDKVFAEIEKKLGMESEGIKPGRRAKDTWSKILGSLRKVQKQPSDIGPHTLSLPCVLALKFYTDMLEEWSTRRESRNDHPQPAVSPVDGSAPSTSGSVKSGMEEECESKEAVVLGEESLLMLAGETPTDFLQRVVTMFPDAEPRVDSSLKSVIVKVEEDHVLEDKGEQEEERREEEEGKGEKKECEERDQEVEISKILDAAMYGDEVEVQEDEEEVLRFISAIQEREGLWRRSSSYYRMPHMKMVWFAEVERACQMRFTGGHNARQRWQRLIAAYRTYVTEVVQGRGLGGFVSPSTRAFKYFEAMRFYDESYQASIAVSRRRETLAAQKRAEYNASHPVMQDGVTLNQMLEAAAAALTVGQPTAQHSARTENGCSEKKRRKRSEGAMSGADTNSTASSSPLPVSAPHHHTPAPPPAPLPPPPPSSRIPIAVTPVQPAIAAAPLPVKEAKQQQPSSVRPAAEPAGPAPRDIAPSHTELYALMDHVMEGLPLIAATEAKGEIISFLVGLKRKYHARGSS